MDESTKLEERLRNRVRRRWRRRARIIAPFAALPLLLGTLLLSVDIIEYAPQPARVTPANVVTSRAPARIQPSLAARHAIATSAVVNHDFMKRDEAVEVDPNANPEDSKHTDELDGGVPFQPRADPTRGDVAP